MKLFGNYSQNFNRFFREICSFQEIQKNWKHVFNLIKYANVKLKMKDLRRSLIATCPHEKKKETILSYFIYSVTYIASKFLKIWKELFVFLASFENKGIQLFVTREKRVNFGGLKISFGMPDTMLV